MQDIFVYNNKNVDEQMCEKFIKGAEKVHCNGTGEELRRLEMMMNITRIIENYDELRPIMTKFFDMKRKERER